mmetsp:Transcript_133841/g.325261  ORF Transcript_133841/g.325261 Transcript_133841/m.325261 type:complete len:119 (-) Transcript_133841:26-382(-)
MSVLQKIADIEYEMSRTQKNKATNAHLGLLKAKLAKLRAQIVSEGSKGGGGGGGGGGGSKPPGAATPALRGAHPCEAKPLPAATAAPGEGSGAGGGPGAGSWAARAQAPARAPAWAAA